MPLGIFAIISATQVKAKLEAGDYEGARRASRKALMLNLVGFIGGFILIGLYVALAVAAEMA